jgi:hypothetical protein
MTDKDNKEKKIINRHTKKWKEYLSTYPDAIAKEQETVDEENNSMSEFYRQVREFKEKVRLLGKQMIETMDNEREKAGLEWVPGHHDFYRFALLELVSESFIEQIKTLPGYNHYLGKSYESFFNTEIEKIRKAQEELSID